MKYLEIEQDLFEVNTGKETGLYCLAHCISADFGMFGGIVVGFNERWNMKNILVSCYGNVEDKFNRDGGFSIPCAVGNDPKKFSDIKKLFLVYNLITKELVSHQPTLKNIELALIDMRNNMIKNHDTRVAMPKIGCGIDGQDWDEVSEIIKKVFRDTDIEILICKRDEVQE